MAASVMGLWEMKDRSKKLVSNDRLMILTIPDPVTFKPNNNPLLELHLSDSSTFLRWF